METTINNQKINEQMFEGEQFNNEIIVQDEKPSVLGTVLTLRYFLPIISSVGALMWASIPTQSIFSLLGIVLMVFGFIAAMTVCPLKLIGFPLVCVACGFKFCRGFVPYYGVGDLIAAIFGTMLGFGFGCLVVLGCPALFTIRKYFKNK